MPEPLSAAALCALIPHAGSMCLLDRVVRWDHDTIHCAAQSHRDPTNPLWRGGQLSIICGVEYAAQAMALHAALSSGRVHRAGYIGALRDVHWSVARLDDIAESLQVHAQRTLGEDQGAIYTFSVRGHHCELMRGRASVFFE